MGEKQRREQQQRSSPLPSLRTHAMHTHAHVRHGVRWGRAGGAGTSLQADARVGGRMGEQVRRDVHWLRECGLMDYSLIVGIMKKECLPDGSPPAFPKGGVGMPNQPYVSSLHPPALPLPRCPCTLPPCLGAFLHVRVRACEFLIWFVMSREYGVLLGDVHGTGARVSEARRRWSSS